MNIRKYVEYISVSPTGVVGAFLVGLAAGALFYGMYFMLTSQALPAIFCRAGNDGYCRSVPTTALVVSVIVAHLIGMLALVRAGIIRPMLVVIAAIATLWGVWQWVDVHTWWAAMILSGLLFGLAYLYYSWINRLLQFPVALGLTVASLIVVRLLIAG